MVEFVALASLLGFCTSMPFNSSRAASPPHTPISVIELSGMPRQIGLEHGRQIGDRIRLLHEKYLKLWFSDQKLYRESLLAALIFRNQLLPEHREEIAALAASAGIDPGEMMLANCFLDMAPTAMCSTITLPAGASPDGVARFGRNLDFPSLDIADKYSIILIFRPEHRYAFAAVSWPGLVGALSGMNEHGLCLANMEVPRQIRMPAAMPYTLLYRSILEQCRTVDEAVELLRKTPRQSANNLMLMDAAGNRAVAEITPQRVVVRSGLPQSALMSTNHQRGLDQNRTGRCWRYDRMRKTSAQQFGKIDLASMKKILDSVSVRGETMQSMIFEPANRVIFAAAGEDATKHPYQRIDLAKYFSKAAR